MTSTEFQIRIILDKNCYSINQKVNKICEFMTWDKKELFNKINEFGLDETGQKEIILYFWDKRRN